MAIMLYENATVLRFFFPAAAVALAGAEFFFRACTQWSVVVDAHASFDGWPLVSFTRGGRSPRRMRRLRKLFFSLVFAFFIDCAEVKRWGFFLTRMCVDRVVVRVWIDSRGDRFVVA